MNIENNNNRKDLQRNENTKNISSFIDKNNLA